MRCPAAGHTDLPGGDGMARWKSFWRRFSKGYVQFVEKQGFFVIITVCIGIIAATAVWTNQAPQPLTAPTLPAGQAASAAQLQQESIKNVSTPSPAPTAAPPVWCAPLDTVQTLRSFDGTRLSRSGVTGVWQLHDAADLACSAGSPVYAMSDGVVVEIAEKGLMGAWARIRHSGGIEAQYAGMEVLAGIQPGDPVTCGQTIGFGGGKVLDETDLAPHLHLRITRDGQAIDPFFLLRQAQK